MAVSPCGWCWCCVSDCGDCGEDQEMEIPPKYEKYFSDRLTRGRDAVVPNVGVSSSLELLMRIMEMGGINLHASKCRRQNAEGKLLQELLKAAFVISIFHCPSVFLSLKLLLEARGISRHPF